MSFKATNEHSSSGKAEERGRRSIIGMCIATDDLGNTELTASTTNVASQTKLVFLDDVSLGCGIVKVKVSRRRESPVQDIGDDPSRLVLSLE